MKKTDKTEVVTILKTLLARYSFEELGVALGRSSMSIRAWAQENNHRTPAKSDWEVLKRMAVKKL